MSTDRDQFEFFIPIERLTDGLNIDIPGHGSAEVYGVQFDGEGYLVTYCYDDRLTWDALDTHYFNPGDSVEHTGAGAPPWLRSRAAVTQEEWEALAEAESAKRAVENACVGAVAESLGVPMQQAAE